MKKRTLIRKKKKEELSMVPDNEPTTIVEPTPKGSFSTIDGDQVKQESYSLRDMAKEVVDAIKLEKKIVVVDQRESQPTIECEVNPTPITVKPEINVEPAKVDIRVPTQRIPDFPVPEVTVNNNTDMRHVILLLYLLSFLLTFLAGALVWLLQTSLNSQ